MHKKNCPIYKFNGLEPWHILAGFSISHKKSVPKHFFQISTGTMDDLFFESVLKFLQLCSFITVACSNLNGC